MLRTTDERADGSALRVAICAIVEAWDARLLVLKESAPTHYLVKAFETLRKATSGEVVGR